MYKIGGYAFYQTGLIAIDIPAHVTSIDKYAFAFNTELRQVYMHRDKPDGYSTGAFEECHKVVIYVPVELYETYCNRFGINMVEVPRKDLTAEIEDGLKTLNTLSDKDRETINTSLDTIKKTESFGEALDAYAAAMVIINAQTTMENKLKGVISTLATKQNGSAIRIVGEDGKTIQLYKIKKVDFIKVNE